MFKDGKARTTSVSRWLISSGALRNQSGKTAVKGSTFSAKEGALFASIAFAKKE